MTWEEILKLLPGYLAPLVIVLYLQHKGMWGIGRELQQLRDLREEEKIRTQFWIDKFDTLLRQTELNTESLERATEALLDATQIVKQVTK